MRQFRKRQRREILVSEKRQKDSSLRSVGQIAKKRNEEKVAQNLEIEGLRKVRSEENPVKVQNVRAALETKRRKTRQLEKA